MPRNSAPPTRRSAEGLTRMSFDFPTIAFLGFAATAVVAGLATITARNPVHAALWLVLAFFSVACTWIVGGAEFLGLVLVLVYVGAVMVLFLFVVMMLDIRIDDVRRGFWKHFPFAALIGVLIAFEMGMVLMGGFGDVEDVKAAGSTIVNAAGQTVPYSNTQALGKLLYTQYLYPVEIAAVILLVAMIAAIALTLRKRKDSKAMNPADQIRVRASDRIKLVKVETTKPAQKPDAEVTAPAVETKA